MKGQFENKEQLISWLRSEGFKYDMQHNGFTYYIKEQTNELAEINIYSDNSASALIGKLK